MIKEKEFAKRIVRIRQRYDSRMNKLRLGMNEYVPHMPKDLFKKIIQNCTLEKVSAYPEVNQAYDALSKFLGQKRNNILITSGADMGIKVVFETFCKEGDIVATCSPTFAMYKIHSDLLNCNFQEINSNNKGEFKNEDLLGLLKNSPRIIIIANPNGVTGFAYDKDIIEELLEKTNKSKTVIVLDETYANFGKIDMSKFIQRYDNLVLVRSFSKNLGMAGMRIGYILSSENLSLMMEKFKPMMEINSFAVEAIKIICSNRKYLNEAVKKIIQSRHNISRKFRELGYEVLERKGNFILVNFKNDRKIIEKILDKNNIEYRKLSEPLENYIRFTVGTKDMMNKFFKVIQENLENEKN